MFSTCTRYLPTLGPGAVLAVASGASLPLSMSIILKPVLVPAFRISSVTMPPTLMPRFLSSSTTLNIIVVLPIPGLPVMKIFVVRFVHHCGFK